MCLPLQRILSVYFRLQKVRDLQLFNVSIEQNIEFQNHCTLEFVDDTRTTIPRVATPTWVAMDVYRSVMKKRNEKDHFEWSPQNVSNSFCHSSGTASHDETEFS